jgi:hypothetical protein
MNAMEPALGSTRKGCGCGCCANSPHRCFYVRDQVRVFAPIPFRMRRYRIRQMIQWPLEYRAAEGMRPGGYGILLVGSSTSYSITSSATKSCWSNIWSEVSIAFDSVDL